MKPLSVLLVENEFLIAMLFTEVLEDMGHTIRATESTEAGSAAAARYEQVPHVFFSGDVAGVKALRPDAVVIQKLFFCFRSHPSDGACFGRRRQQLDRFFIGSEHTTRGWS